MIDWSADEQTVLHNFLSFPGPVRDALMRYTSERVEHYNMMCAAYMSTVPRDPERAADYAAKAQELKEFWTALADSLRAEQMAVGDEPSL